MPKISAVGGATLAGHVDVSSGASTPEWVPAEAVTEPAEQPAPGSADPVKPRRRPAPRRTS